MQNYKVLIEGVGLKEVKAKDIDDAYIVACKEFDCKIKNILSVMWPELREESAVKKGGRKSGL